MVSLLVYSVPAVPCLLRGAGRWAKCVMCSVAMIYFARLALASLAHKQALPQEFKAYNMPRWWGFYRNLGEVTLKFVCPEQEVVMVRLGNSLCKWGSSPVDLTAELCDATLRLA